MIGCGLGGGSANKVIDIIDKCVAEYEGKFEVMAYRLKEAKQ